MPEGLRFKAVTAHYERALRATAHSDATRVELHVPTDRDRARSFEHRPSPEGADVLEAQVRRDQAGWDGVWDRMFDSLTAHDYKVTNYALDRRVNLALLTSGLGDGRYPVYAGFDTAGRPTRIVVDFLLLHFKWR